MSSLPTPALPVLERAQALLEAGDALAIELYAMGHRAGISAERSRVQLEAAAFGTYLGPAPALPDYYGQPAPDPARPVVEPLRAMPDRQEAA